MKLKINLCNLILFLCINSFFCVHNFLKLKGGFIMKKFLLMNKKIICAISILIILLISIYSISFGSESYEKTDFEYAKVTASHLNIRRGPRHSFSSCWIT